MQMIVRVIQKIVAVFCVTLLTGIYSWHATSKHMDIYT